ncbi:MAG: hypothetical protein RhofKO_19510 [Rhodothermales bacterium]
MEIVRAFPILPGKEGDLKAFIEQLNGELSDHVHAFYRQYGVQRESWHLQQTPTDTLLICVSKVGLPRKMIEETYSNADAEFDTWFKSQVRALSGVDPNQDPLGPATECIFEY